MSDLSQIIWSNLLKKKAATSQKDWAKVTRLVQVTQKDIEQAVEKAVRDISVTKKEKPLSDDDKRYNNDKYPGSQ